MGERPFSIKSYHDFLAEGKIMGSSCRTCDAIYIPPRPLCPRCGGVNMGWRELAGRGVIQAFTVIRVPLTSMKDRVPYTCGIVRLEEGPSISALLLDAHDVEKTGIGTSVQAEFVREGNRTRLCFRPLPISNP